MIVLVAVAVAAVTLLLLTATPLRHADWWRAAVTPLASIIGSGFLIAGPLLAREFGLAAGAAMAILLVFAYLVGSVMRFNIRTVEPYLAAAEHPDFITLLAASGQPLLGLAYAVSVAYYLKLFAEFALKNVAASHVLISDSLVTAIIAVLVLLTFTGGIGRVLKLAQAAVSLNLSVIAGMLVALAIHWWAVAGAPLTVVTPKPSFHGLALLLGLVITVQGFETSRYLGGEYAAGLRIRTMRYAQGISSVIYLLFILLLTPFLARAAATGGVAGILNIMELIAPMLGILVLVGASASQLGAAVADSSGAAGLLAEASHGRVGIRTSYLAACTLSLAVVWLTDPFEVVALASRAFALYYAVQCVLAAVLALRGPQRSLLLSAGFGAIGVVCVLAALVGAPAE